VILNAGTLIFNRSDVLPVANDISGSGRLVQQGAGTTTLTGANTYSGTTTIANGALQIGDGGTSGTLGFGTVTNNGTLIFDRSDALTAANTISGSGKVVQQGAGTTTLTGTNSYAGTTAIDAGTLLLDGSHTGGAGYTVAAGATLGGTGRTDSAVTIDGAIRPGDGTTQGVLQIGTLTLNNTGLLNILLGGTTSSLLSVTGNISLFGGIDFTVAPALTADLYPLVSYTGNLSGVFLAPTNLPAGFNLVYGTNNTIFLERVPTIDGAAVLSQGDALITGGSLPFGVLVYNNSTNSPVSFALSAGTDTIGSFGPTNLAAGGDTNAAGLAYNGTNIGTNTGTYVLTNVTAGTAKTNNVTVKVYDHAAGSLSTNMVVMPDVIVGYGAALSETLTVSNGAGFRVGLDSVSVNTNANFVVGDVANVAPGASGTMQVVLNPGQGAGFYSNVVGVSFADSSALPGATSNLTPTNFAVTGTVFDHAAAVIVANTISFAPVHAGYTAVLTNSLTIANESGVRVAMQTTNTITNSLFSLGTVSGLAPGASAALAAALQPGQPVGQFTNTVAIGYGDDSTLDGALTKVGTTNVIVTGYIYSGQSTWTNRGTGNWTDFANWDVPGGTPGLDGVLSVNDTATFGAAGSGDVVLDTNASVLGVVFSNNSASYTVSGSGTLTMAASGATGPSISNLAGAHVIGASVALPDDVRIETATGSSLELAGAVSGAGGLTKNGPGLLAMSGNNPYSGGTTLNAGDLVVSSLGALGGGAVILNAGTLTLESRIDMASMFWNGAATIAMANPAGGQFVNIAHGLTLVNGINSFDLTRAVLPRSPVKLMTASNMGSLSVDLFGVVGLDRYTLLIEGDSLFITAKPASYVPYAITPNQASVAGALDTFIGAGGDRGAVVAALDSLTDAQYPAAFEQTLPNAYASLPNMAFNTANAINSGMFQRLWVIRINGKGFSSSGLSPAPLRGEVGGVDDMEAFAISPSRETKWGTFVDANGIFANGGDVNYLQNYRSQSGGVTSGASYKWNGSLSTGVYVGYQGLQAEYDNGRTVDNAVRFGVFGTYDLGSLYFNALVGGAYHGYTVNRTIDFGGLDRTATGRPGAGEFDLALGTGYDFKAGDFSWGPFTTLQYTYLGVQGFTETGAGALDLDVDPYNSSSMLYTLGGQAAYNWKLSRDVIVTPTVFAGWQHEFLQDSYQINSSFNTGGPAAPFSYTTGMPARDNFYGGAGVTVGLGDRWQATAIYSAFVANQDQSSQNLYLGLGYKF
jgi:autotransporter-associated beta strand protein